MEAFFSFQENHGVYLYLFWSYNLYSEISKMDSQTQKPHIQLSKLLVFLFSLLDTLSTLHSYFKCENIVRLTFTNIILVLQEMIAFCIVMRTQILLSPDDWTVQKPYVEEVQVMLVSINTTRHRVLDCDYSYLSIKYGLFVCFLIQKVNAQ